VSTQTDAFQPQLDSREARLIQGGKLDVVIRAHLTHAEAVMFDPSLSQEERERRAANSRTRAKQLQAAMDFEKGLPW